MEKNDNFKQRKISDMFSVKPKVVSDDYETVEDEQSGEDAADIEDIGGKATTYPIGRPVVTTHKRKRIPSLSEDKQNEELKKSWREALGPPPPLGKTKVSDRTA